MFCNDLEIVFEKVFPGNTSLPVSAHFYALLRPCNLVSRDLPPQGQIEEKPGTRLLEPSDLIGSYSQAYTIEIELL